MPFTEMYEYLVCATFLSFRTVIKFEFEFSIAKASENSSELKTRTHGKIQYCFVLSYFYCSRSFVPLIFAPSIFVPSSWRRILLRHLDVIILPYGNKTHQSHKNSIMTKNGSPEYSRTEVQNTKSGKSTKTPF